MTNDFGIWFRDHDHVYLLDLKGGKKLKMVLPRYPNRKLWSYRENGEILAISENSNMSPLRTRLRTMPRPKIKLDMVHGTAEESLDGKTWRPIDLKPKDPDTGK